MIVVDDADVGRFVFDEDAERLLLVDLAVVASVRGRGVGSAVLRGALDRADERGLPVRLQVERTNRARRLYERLGFEVVERGPDRLAMERAGRR